MNKKTFDFALLFILFCQSPYAQQDTISNKTSGVKSFAKVTIGFQNGLEWEQKINKISVVDFFAGVGIGYAADGFSFSDLFKTKLIVSPDVFAEYRTYYNLGKRISNQKNTTNNSANFVYARVECLLPVKNQNFLNLLFIQGWGFQRSIKRKISLTYWLGITEHFYYDKPPRGGFNYIKLEPELTLLFSYIL